MIIKEIKYLFFKELQLELRKKSGINSILLFVVATTFISYLAVDTIEDSSIWNALFWIILLFAYLNAANNIFRTDTENTQLYLNQLAHPNSILSAKILYSSFLMILTGLLNYVCYSLFVGNLITNHFLFILLICIGALGFAAVLSLTNAISSKASFNNSLLPVLSLPLLVPFFIILIAQTNHLIGSKEYHSISYGKVREGMEVEILCKQLKHDRALSELNCSLYTATDEQLVETPLVFCGNLSVHSPAPIIVKGKYEKGVFYAAAVWNKSTQAANSTLKYYGALTLLTLIVLLLGQFLFPKIAKF